MQGKVCVITGATSGIGLIAAERLAAQGARLVLIGRDRARGEAALARIRARVPGAQLAIRYADLSRLAEMDRLAAEIAAAEPRIDVLINNAGAMFSRRSVTEDGLERTFALNHMAYFVLTEPAARPPPGGGARAHRQRRLRRASRRHARFRRSPERAQLSRLHRLWPLQARQYSLHPRAGAPAGGQRRHRQLPPSRFRRHALWRQQWRPHQPRHRRGEESLCHQPGEGGRDHRLSRELARGRLGQRRLFR